jgi:hypothetical protein
MINNYLGNKCKYSLAKWYGIVVIPRSKEKDVTPPFTAACQENI